MNSGKQGQIQSELQLLKVPLVGSKLL